MKEQDKTPEKQLNEVEIGNIPEKEFSIMIVKMIQDLGKRMEAKIEKMQEMFNKDLEIKKQMNHFPSRTPRKYKGTRTFWVQNENFLILNLPRGQDFQSEKEFQGTYQTQGTLLV